MGPHAHAGPGPQLCTWPHSHVIHGHNLAPKGPLKLSIELIPAPGRELAQVVRSDLARTPVVPDSPVLQTVARGISTRVHEAGPRAQPNHPQRRAAVFHQLRIPFTRLGWLWALAGWYAPQHLQHALAMHQ